MDVADSGFCGYMTCYYRNFTCGRASQEQKETYAAAIEMLRAGMTAIKAGNTSLDIIKAWPSPEYWGKTDWNAVWHYATAHGLGLELHEKPTVTAPLAMANPVKLEEGMVLAAETFTLTKDGKGGAGGRPEEEVVVTKDGYELLTKFPVDEITEAWI